MQKRKNNKQILVNTFGGKCQICGFNKCLAALEFHHRNKSDKEFNISKYAGNNKITYEMIKELEKTILLCANCHRMVHQGLLKEELEEIPDFEFDLEF